MSSSAARARVAVARARVDAGLTEWVAAVRAGDDDARATAVVELATALTTALDRAEAELERRRLEADE